MALSTTIPRTMMRPARVQVLRGMPMRYMMPMDMKVLRGTITPATTAVRQGKRISMTMTMMNQLNLYHFRQMQINIK